MLCQVQSKEIEELRMAHIPTQTQFWARVKHQQGFIPQVFGYSVTDDVLVPTGSGNQKRGDDMLVLLRYLKQDRCMAYVPYGPKMQPDMENYGVFLEELSEVLRSQLPGNCVFIKYDLPWESPWAVKTDSLPRNGQGEGPPSLQAQEFRINFNTHNWQLHKSQGDILPANTMFLDLTPGLEELYARMKSKTRYNIRLAGKKGVRVNRMGVDAVDQWYELYKQTARRNHMTLLNKSYFSSVLRHQRYPKVGKKGVKVTLLMADSNGEYLAGMFLVFSGKRATYLYGASSDNNRHLMATYLLQWSAIREAKEFGCTEYDMFGCSPGPDQAHPMYGLFRYKKGFGGKLFHRMGCWDYPLLPDEYPIFKALEGTWPGYHS